MFLLLRNKYSMWHRTPYNTLCSQRRRMVESFNSLILWYPLLLYWFTIKEMFRKLAWTQNLPWYWAGCFWSGWSPNDICKLNTNVIFQLLFLCQHKKKVFLFHHIDIGFRSFADIVVFWIICKCNGFFPFLLISIIIF